MALIGLKVPQEAARLLEAVEVPGERHSSSDMHVTILFLGHGTSIIDVAKAMCASYQVAQTTKPFLCGIDAVSSFPANPDDGVPIICPVHSPGLHALNLAMRAGFDRLGIKYSKTYPTYEPHVTLSYLKDPAASGSYSARLPGPLTWTASDMMIWGDEMDQSLSINLPFVLSPMERAARRLADSFD